MISNEHKYIYIHIPKCAGTSIEQALTGTQHAEWDAENKIWVQHATASQIEKHYCINFNDYFSFTFVRNPWDRILSDYFWMQRNLNIKDTFKNYVKLEGVFDDPRLKYPPTSRKTRYDHTRSQCDYILDISGNIMLNYIGKFENLQQDFNIICDKIGIPHHQLPHENATKHKHYTEYYDEETKSIVAERYAKDIELFGYKFGE